MSNLQNNMEENEDWVERMRSEFDAHTDVQDLSHLNIDLAAPSFSRKLGQQLYETTDNIVENAQDISEIDAAFIEPPCTPEDQEKFFKALGSRKTVIRRTLERITASGHVKGTNESVMNKVHRRRNWDKKHKSKNSKLLQIYSELKEIEKNAQGGRRRLI
ncbi:hypothetical protein ABW19_dt0203805 [Dactylella cylindrospora]|nr:hypothetical protein ABW19_dt0203805 [Dactylella cylindrospora]